ncbi:MAG: endo-1,4-beta-xylanase [Ignavibacteriales bacterium]|nr:endo-1,4-beta-xylanase [Ignavibacteriales bacterium]
MKKPKRAYSRRDFIGTAAGAGAFLAASGLSAFPAPTILTASRTRPSIAAGTLRFLPHYVQRGSGPHLLDWAYASDSKGDAFRSDIAASRDGLLLSDTKGEGRFAVNVRWNVEEFGYIFITADNGGEFYKLPPNGREQSLNLNFELAKSRVVQNRTRRAGFEKTGWKPSRETKAYLDLSEDLFGDARRSTGEPRRGLLSQKSLTYAMWASEMMELEKARFNIESLKRPRADFFFGCDARAFYQMYQDTFLELFPELFDYAMVTYVIKGDGMMSDFEPVEGKRNFGTRDVLVRKLRERNITVQGRTLFWFYDGVTPDWLKRKSFEELKKYVERHTRETIAHYPEEMFGWEIFNEFHDWAVEVDVTPEQTVELVKLSCDVARDTNPDCHRIINNCCPFAEYVQLGKTSGGDARYPQRTPWEFTKDLVDAGVDFTMLGQQMYFPYRDLQDIMVFLERMAEFRRPVQLSEVGAPGGPTNLSVKTGSVGFPEEPFIWRRPWDEELQADWLEAVCTLAFSRPWIVNFSWFDLLDRGAFQKNGGLLRNDKGEKKAAWHRFKKLQNTLKQSA